MENKGKNSDRTRYYGIRVGDTIQFLNDKTGLVVQYGFMDNNQVFVQFEEQEKPIAVIAEWCKVLVKVEDKGEIYPPFKFFYANFKGGPKENLEKEIERLGDILDNSGSEEMEAYELEQRDLIESGIRSLQNLKPIEK